MNDPKTSPSLAVTRVVATCSIALGPCAAWLFELGYIDFFADANLLNVWVVVGIAIAGMAIGGYAVAHGARILGAGSLVFNSGVVALYGFLGLFFGLGGSR